MESHEVIIKSIEYPPLLIDSFGQYDQWMEKYYNLQKIHFDDHHRFYFHIICDSLDKVSSSNLFNQDDHLHHL
ncbi:unnamed protein product [Adineta steineri]|uniref:Uncharacterized protein n=1 Tax=Adineta steineri TaxID=433720 RepID=A0A814ZZ51_9BILA|nr:unnamed protein product [Adineta steineri]CAF1249862.1 unnamed protein product [Adineta steineri]CAF1382107.1 unnamed protein product [Adineta steineri]